MFKKIKPEKLEVLLQFPHCDARVLHAPKTCEFCDQHSNWQTLRQVWGIAFTGWEPEKGELPCPSDFNRGLGGAHVWPGNVPTGGKK